MGDFGAVKSGELRRDGRRCGQRRQRRRTPRGQAQRHAGGPGRGRILRDDSFGKRANGPLQAPQAETFAIPPYALLKWWTRFRGLAMAFPLPATPSGERVRTRLFQHESRGDARVGLCVRSSCLASRPVSRTNTDYRAAAPPCRGAFVCPGLIPGRRQWIRPL